MSLWRGILDWWDEWMTSSWESTSTMDDSDWDDEFFSSTDNQSFSNDHDCHDELFERNVSDDSLGETRPEDDLATINPATGLPMLEGPGGLDMAGNPYGFDHDHDMSSSQNDWTDSHSDFTSEPGFTEYYDDAFASDSSSSAGTSGTDNDPWND